MNNELKGYLRKLLCPILGYCSALGYMKNFGQDNQPASCPKRAACPACLIRIDLIGLAKIF
jgi:hypothetical protein